MAHVKKITVDAIYFLARPRNFGYYWQSDTFLTFTEDNGEKHYLVNGKEVTMEEGNKAYLNIKESNMDYRGTKDCKSYIKRQRGKYGNKNFTVDDTFKRKVEEYDITYDEIIAKLEKSIDHYTQYIDDYSQQVEAEKANSKIYEQIKKVRKMKGEYKYE